MPSSLEILDQFYAEALGCAPEDLNSGRPMVVVNKKLSEITFAKGQPLALYAIDKGSGPVISVRPPLDRIIRKLQPQDFQELASGNVQRVDKLTSAMSLVYCFEGIRLFCSPETFVERSAGDVRNVTTEDKIAADLHGKWGGEVFGRILDGKVVSWAAVKPISDAVWDLRVETLPECQGRGYASSVVSEAAKHIFEHGKLAGWGTDRTNIPSLRTARSVGFQDYGMDFGCVEDPSGG